MQLSPAEKELRALKMAKAGEGASRLELIRRITRARKQLEFEELASDLRSDEDAGEVEAPEEMAEDKDFEDAVRD